MIFITFVWLILINTKEGIKQIPDNYNNMEDPEYYNLRNYALDFLYRRFAHDDE